MPNGYKSSLSTHENLIYSFVIIFYITVARLKLFNQSRLRLTLCGMWISVYSTCQLVYLHPPDFFFSNCGPLFHECPCEVLSQVVNVQRVYWEFKSVLHITSKFAGLLQISTFWPLWGNGLLQAIEILSIVFTAYSNDGHVTLFALSISKLRTNVFSSVWNVEGIWRYTTKLSSYQSGLFMKGGERAGHGISLALWQSNFCIIQIINWWPHECSHWKQLLILRLSPSRQHALAANSGHVLSL